MRDCNHMPGAAKDVKCPLCRDLKTFGKATSKHAITVLNNQTVKEKGRVCVRCSQEVGGLVTRKGVLMCEPCAVAADEDEL